MLCTNAHILGGEGERHLASKPSIGNTNADKSRSHAQNVCMLNRNLLTHSEKRVKIADCQRNRTILKVDTELTKFFVGEAIHNTRKTETKFQTKG